MEDLLHLTDDDEETTIEATKKEKLIEFEPLYHEDDEIQYYQAIVPNSFQYDALTKKLQKGYHSVIPWMFMKNPKICQE